jgi:signal recognition particle subunit SEC65
MKSFQRMNEFERVATLPSITIDELAKCLVGVSPTTAKKYIIKDKLEVITHIHMRMTRTLEEIFKLNSIPRVTRYGQYRTTSHPVNSDERIITDIICATGFNCTDNEFTPPSILERCETAVNNIAMNNKTRLLLPFIGGEAEDLGRKLISNNRGLYKKDEEIVNINKLLGIAVNLLALEKNKTNPSKWIKKDNVVCVEHLKEIIDEYIEKNDISNDGLKSSSLRAKLSSALKAIYD